MIAFPKPLSGITYPVRYLGAMPARLRRADYLSPPPSALKRSANNPSVYRPAIDKLDTVTGTDGRFRIGDVDTGLYRLEIGNGAEESGVVDVDIADLKQHPGDRIDLADTRLGKAAGVGGTVTLRADAVQAYVQVYGLERLASVETGTGRFALRLPTGKYRLRFIDPDCGPACMRLVDVTVAQDPLLQAGRPYSPGLRD